MPNYMTTAQDDVWKQAAAAQAAAGTGPEKISSGTNPQTGFAADMGYTPEAMGALWETPWAVLPDVFKAFQNPNAQAGPGYQALRDFGADPLTLYNIMVGATKDMTSSSGNAPGNYANWLASLYGSLGERGGRGFSGRELISNIFNPGGGSTLKQVLTAGDAATQLRTVFNLIREATNVGVNPMAARAYQAQVARLGDLAVNQTLKQNAGEGANAVPVYETLRKLMAGQGYRG